MASTQNVSDDFYASRMGRSFPERERMDQQCQLISIALGWNYGLHPSVAANLPPKPAIADIACGTARFLRDLAPAYPDATLDGYDISSAFFPSTDTTEPNIRCYVQDAKQSFPEETIGRYDLVHVRYLVVGMAPADWEPTVKNLLSLVKPGGYLMWTEADFTSDMQIRRGKPDSQIAVLAETLAKFRTPAFKERVAHGWNELPDLMRKAGLDSVESDVVSNDRDPSTRQIFTENGIILLLTALREATAKGAPGVPTATQIDQLEQRLKEETSGGAYARYDIWTAVGRKPSVGDKAL